MSVTAAVVQKAINLKMPRISHPMTHLDCRSNLVSKWEQVLPWDPLPRVTGDLLANTDYVEIEESKGICFIEKYTNLDKYTICNLYKSQNIKSY